MPRHVKARRTKAIFLHKPKANDTDEKTEQRDEATSKNLTHQHDLPSIPRKLQPVLRKPLNTYYTSKKLRKSNRRHERELLRAIGLRLDHHAKSFGGTKIHPIAVLAWLSAEEPFSVDFLLENSNLLLEEPSDSDDEDTYKVVDPVLIEQLDGLLDKFAKSTIDNAPTSEENVLLKVPKDYSMAQRPHLVEGADDYDVMMDDLEKEVESQEKVGKTWSFRDSSLPATTRPREKEQLGFDPVQVLKKHAIQFQETSTPKVCTLNNPIHPIFSAENFHGCPAAIYSALAPGMRLASLLLTHKSTASFWHTLKFGQRESVFRDHDWSIWIRTAVPWSAENDKRWRAYLGEVSKQIHITFALWPTEKDHGVWAYGTMHPVRDYKRGYLAPSSDSLSAQPRTSASRSSAPAPAGYRPGRLNLHMDFYTTAKRLSLLRTADAAQVLRFNAFVAVNLCHELAHYVEMGDPARVAVAEPFAGAKGSMGPEAFFLGFPWREMGAAFESHVFGACVQPVSCRTDCLYGLCAYEHGGDGASAAGASSRAGGRATVPSGRLGCGVQTFWTVPMAYVARIQQKENWEMYAEEGDAEWLRIPREGAEAVRVPYFDLTVWKDEAEDPISDEKDGRLTPFRRTRDGRIEKRLKSPPKVDLVKIEKALERSKSPLSNQIDGQDSNEDGNDENEGDDE